MSDEIRDAIAAVRGALGAPPVCPLCGCRTREERHPSEDDDDRPCWTYHCLNEARADGGGCGYEWGLSVVLRMRQHVVDDLPAQLRSALCDLLSALDGVPR